MFATRKLRPRRRTTAALLSATALAVIFAAPAEATAGAFTEANALIPFVPDARSLVEDVAFFNANGDEHTDLIVAVGTASFDGRRNQLFLGTGVGFTPAPLPVINDDSSDIAIADIDNDGDSDLLFANVGRETLLLNNGDGTFVNATNSLPTPPPIGDDISVSATFCDVNGDAFPDILVANERPGFPSGAQNQLWINTGAGSFVDETAARVPVRRDQTSDIACDDPDADGDNDLVVGNNGQNFFLRNDGSGFFTDTTASNRLPRIADSTRQLTFGDVDGDGDLDLYVANSRGQQDRLLLNNGVGQFTDVTATNLPVDGDRTLDADLVDIDGDGDLDVYKSNIGPYIGSPFAHNFTGEQNDLYENNGAGVFVDVTAAHLPAIVDQSFGADVGDADGDGDMDIVVANGHSEPVRLYLQI